MSKYTEQSKVNDEIVRVLEHTDCKDEYIDRVLMAIESLPTIEVSEDCISRGWVKENMKKYGFLAPDMTVTEFVENAPSVVPTTEQSSMAGRWQITDAYPHNVYCSECHKKFAQTHWAVWEDGSLPRNFCPNCGAKMEG